MADAQSIFKAVVQDIFDEADIKSGGSKLGIFDFGYLFEQLKIAAIEAAKDLAAKGIQKKEVVMAEVDAFIDAYLPLPWYLAVLRKPIKSLLHGIVDGAIEALYKKLFPPTPATT